MRGRTMLRSAPRMVAALTLAVTAAGLGGAAPARASTQVLGIGSTWSQIAIDQWRADVAHQGLDINYQGQGSTAGRVAYYQDQSDFSVSEIPFQPRYDPGGGGTVVDEVANAAHRPYAYLPIVAGGTSFMYHIDVNGSRVTNLKLSAATLTGIFTGGIKNWNDAAITADNGGTQLPSLPIIPVVRSDGSGTSAQFTAWMAAEKPDVWNAFCAQQGITTNPCGSQSQYPIFPGAIGQQLSDGVAGYVAADYNNGSITYVEYAYALQRNFPVASVLNAGGYYTQPTAQDVAIALQGATLNSDRTQNLTGVYAFPDARAYPVSSYSYMIVPTTTAAPFSTDKGSALGQFILYFVCAGQQKVADLGYSPLPPNLVQAAFDAEQLIPNHPAPPQMANCSNPTITGGFTTQGAPLPPPSAKQGAPTPPPGDTSAQSNPSSTASPDNGGGGGGPSATNPTGTAANATQGSSGPGGRTATTRGRSSSAKSGATRTSGSSGGSSSSASSGGSNGSGSGTSDQALGPKSVTIASTHVAMGPFALIALIVLLLVFLPPTVVVLHRRRPTQL